MSGKWHVKTNADRIFNNVIHVRPGMPNQVEIGYNRPKSSEDTTWRAWDKANEGFWKGGKHWSEVLGDDAIQFIENASQKNNPFFMYLAFNAPHDPRQSPKEYVDMYPLESIAIPPSFLEEYPYKEEMGAGKGLRDERLAPFPRTEYAIQINRQEYYAIITHMDTQIGRIYDALEASGKLENTYIIFAADHGLSLGHHGLMGKQSMYDHSMRTPLLISGPGLSKNKQIDADVYVQDIMPTVLELANVTKPDFVDFHSLFPLVQNRQKESNYKEIYGAYTHTQRMIRKDKFKLITYPEANKIRLFDLENDPEEMMDISEDPSFQTKKENLYKALLKLQIQMKDQLELEEINFH